MLCLLIKFSCVYPREARFASLGVCFLRSRDTSFLMNISSASSSSPSRVLEVKTAWAEDAGGHQCLCEVQLSLAPLSSTDVEAVATTLWWDRELQRFVATSAPCDVEEETKLKERRIEGCLGVYGVVPLGHYDASLLLITEAAPIRCSHDGRVLTLPGGHEVFEIKKMLHLPLPSKSFHPQDPAALLEGTLSSTSGGPGPGDTARSHPSSPPLNPNDINISGDHSPNHHHHTGERAPSQISKAALTEYRRLLTTFARCRLHHDGVHLYYSPTCPELCYSSAIADALLGRSQGRPMSRSTSPSHHVHNQIEATFRWNSNLLDAFYPRSAHGTPYIQPTPHPSNSKPALGGQVKQADHASWIQAFVPSVFRGYVGGDVVDGSHITAALVTRLACTRAGTRYNRRGLDAATGVVANFSETTQLLYNNDNRIVSSFRLIRGSIPRCWQQPANLTFKPSINVSAKDRGHRELRLHLSRLSDLFGQQFVHCIDATSKSTFESPLSEAYAGAFEPCEHKVPPSPSMGAASGTHDEALPPLCAVYTKFDVGTVMKREKLYHLVQEQLLALVERPVGLDNDGSRAGLVPSVYIGHKDTDGSWQQVDTQPGLFRVNCLDCLDRANLVQSMLCLHVAQRQVAACGKTETPEMSLVNATSSALRGLWAGNGTALSALYAGSKPHFLDILVTGKRASALHRSIDGGHIALQRYLQQNFFDGPKQDTVSLVTRSFHVKPVSANPFDRRMTTYKALMLLALAFAVGASLVNGGLMLAFERYRFRTDFMLVQAMWCAAMWFLGWKIFKEPSLVASVPVLESR